MVDWVHSHVHHVPAVSIVSIGRCLRISRSLRISKVVRSHHWWHHSHIWIGRRHPVWWIAVVSSSRRTILHSWNILVRTAEFLRIMLLLFCWWTFLVSVFFTYMRVGRHTAWIIEGRRVVWNSSFPRMRRMNCISIFRLRVVSTWHCIWSSGLQTVVLMRIIVGHVMRHRWLAIRKWLIWLIWLLLIANWFFFLFSVLWSFLLFILFFHFFPKFINFFTFCFFLFVFRILV